MKLLETLKQLKTIRPDPAYVARSRRELLGVDVEPAAQVRGPWAVVLHTFQFGSAVALTAVLIVLVAGGFSAWRALSPLRVSSLDPTGLRAEAQAVDIQIQLTDLDYTEPTALLNQTTTIPIAPRSKADAEPTSIDGALDKLSR